MLCGPHLVYISLNPVIQDKADQQALNVSLRYVQRVADEGQPHTRVGLDQLQQHLQRQQQQGKGDSRQAGRQQGGREQEGAM